MQPAIGILCSIDDKDRPGYKKINLDIRRRLTLEEHERCLSAILALSSFRATSELFALVPANLRDYQEAEMAVLDGWKDRNRRPDVARNAQLDLNRRILNFLSSARTYLDHTETSLKRRYGKDSSIVEEFARITSHFYDNQFSYRFAYRLRNYSQHCGLPANSIHFQSLPDRDDPSIIHHWLQVALTKDYILTDFDWGPLADEISALPRIIEIPPILEGFSSALHAVNQEITEAELDLLIDPSSVIHYWREVIGEIDGEPYLFELEGEENDAGEVDLTHLSALRFVSIPFETASFIMNRELDGGS